MSEPVQVIRAADLVDADPTSGMARSPAFETDQLLGRSGRDRTGFRYRDGRRTSKYDRTCRESDQRPHRRQRSRLSRKNLRFGAAFSSGRTSY